MIAYVIKLNYKYFLGHIDEIIVFKFIVYQLTIS